MYVYGAASHSPSPAGMVMVFPPFEVVDSFFLSLPHLWPVVVGCGGGVYVYMMDISFLLMYINMFL